MIPEQISSAGSHPTKGQDFLQTLFYRGVSPSLSLPTTLPHHRISLRPRYTFRETRAIPFGAVLRSLQISCSTCFASIQAPTCRWTNENPRNTTYPTAFVLPTLLASGRSGHYSDLKIMSVHRTPTISSPAQEHLRGTLIPVYYSYRNVSTAGHKAQRNHFLCFTLPF